MIDIKYVNLNMDKRRLVFLILSVLIIIVIYSNSMQGGVSSSNASSRFMMFLDSINLFNNKLYLFVENIFIYALNLDKQDATQIVVRKIAHITEFFILSFCINQFFIKDIYKIRVSDILLSANVCFILAFLDETIQLFMNGRSGQIQDVIIDFIGVFIGCIMVILINNIIKMINKKEKI